MSLWLEIEAEREFKRQRKRADRARLAVHDPRTLWRRAGGRVREIPLEAITGSVEPGRAREFDHEFRPSRRTRARWLRVWLAEHDGPGLPPIDVVRVGNTYAVRDGHHRVSVARARGAISIDALVA